MRDLRGGAGKLSAADERGGDQLDLERPARPRREGKPRPQARPARIDRPGGRRRADDRRGVLRTARPMIGRRLLCTAALLAPLAAARAQASDPGGDPRGDPKFVPFLSGVRVEALRAGVDQGTIDSALLTAEPIPRVMELARNQPEFKMSFDEYTQLVVSPER